MGEDMRRSVVLMMEPIPCQRSRSLRGTMGTAARGRVPKRRKFASVEHLSPEAVAAFVDGELTEGAAHRARVHLVHCPECRAEIHHQRGTSEWVRGCNITDDVRVPRDLLARLAGIATSPVSPGPDAESTPTAQPEGLLDKFEVMLRAVKLNHRYRRQ